MGQVIRTAVGAVVMLIVLAVSPFAQSVRQIGPGLLPPCDTNGYAPLYSTATRSYSTCGAAGGGNPFDQELNTDDSPTFEGLTISDDIYVGPTPVDAVYDAIVRVATNTPYTGGHNMTFYSAGLEDSSGYPMLWAHYTARGTVEVPTAVHIGDYLWEMDTYSHNGTAYNDSAYGLVYTADAIRIDGAVPTRWEFAWTPPVGTGEGYFDWVDFGRFNDGPGLYFSSAESVGNGGIFITEDDDVAPLGADGESMGVFRGAYKSFDGSAGVTAAGCAAFKNGLCTTSAGPSAPTLDSLQREIAELRSLIAALLPAKQR